MTTRDLARTPAVRAAFVLLVAASALVVWSLAGALRAHPVPNAAAGGTAVSLAALPRRVPSPPADVEAAVDEDLFSPERAAPAAPYRMPGESSASDKPAVEPTKPAVLGTAVATDGRSFATLQLGGNPPMLAHVGDKIGEWVVRSIQRGKVMLTSAGGSRAELTVPKPGT